MSHPWPKAAPDPVPLLQQLIRFDTTNPPGNEGPCIAWIQERLQEAGVETRILARDPNRPNLIARLPGRGEAPPLLLYGHVDVVTTAGQAWTHPPFEGRRVDGYVWGRGALDMKGGIAMFLAALLRLRQEGTVPPGDLIFLALSDEEGGGDYGARFLVEEHPDLFQGIRYALGEFGGFSLTVGGRRFYPIMVAEKQICWLRATLRGPGGHGSLPMRGGAMAKLGRFLTRLDRGRLPVHIPPVVRRMLTEMATALPAPTRWILRGLLVPPLTDRILALMGERGRVFEPLLRNTVNATRVYGGEKVNVIPSQIQVELDGRLLPGYTPDDLLRELEALVGDEAEFEVLRHDPGPPEPDWGGFDALAGVLRELDPEGVPVPLLLAGVTDARFFARLGIQTYGFLPMPLPEELNFSRLIHAADERIPEAALYFGAEAIYRAVVRGVGG